MAQFFQDYRVAVIQQFFRVGITAGVLILLTACGGGGGGGSTPPRADTTPNAFSFTDQVDIAFNIEVISNAITISGIDAAANISIIGGEYSIAGGTYTSVAGTVSNAQTVTVRQTSSNSSHTSTDAILTIGGVSATFTVTTIVDNTPPIAAIDYPPAVSLTEGSTVIVRGTASDNLSVISGVQVNGMEATSSDGFATWSVQIALATGENVIKVSATDAALNTGIDLAQVTVSRGVINDIGFPNNSERFDYANDLVLDKANGRILVVDDGANTKSAIVAVNLQTGIREVFSSNTVPNINAPLFSFPRAAALDNTGGRNRLLVVGESNAIISVNLTTGERSTFSENQNPAIARSFGITILGSENRAFITNSSSVDVDLVEVDLNTGVRTLRASDVFPNSENTLDNATALALDIVNNRILVTDFRSHAVLAVSLNDWTRQIISSMTFPDANNLLNGPSALILDKRRNRLLVGNENKALIADVSLESASLGVRNVFSDSVTPDTINPISQAVGIALDEQRQIMYVLENRGSQSSIVAIDMENAQRVIFSKSFNK